MSGAFHAKLARQLFQRAGLRFFRFFSRPLAPRPGVAPDRMELRLLQKADVLALCGDPELELRVEGVSAAYARGDLCVGAFDGAKAVGYCWLAFAPLPHLDHVWVRFDRTVAWTYKSLVRLAYRGRGVAPALYRFADDECRERECSRSVICVESHNSPSVRAAVRAGYAPAGYAGYVLRGRRLLHWSSPAVQRLRVAFFLPDGGSRPARPPTSVDLRQ
jgi:GNAT superfamily N-acetyltransferase